MFTLCIVNPGMSIHNIHRVNGAGGGRNEQWDKLNLCQYTTYSSPFTLIPDIRKLATLQFNI